MSGQRIPAPGPTRTEPDLPPQAHASQRRSPAGRNRVFWDLAVWVLIVAYIAFFGTFTILKHNAFQTTAFDLGNVDQAVWNTRHGQPFATTNIEGLTDRLGTHVEPILLPISLLYFVWSDPRTLLLLQTVVIALGAWPLYLLAKRQIGRWTDERMASILALTLALAYLLFPALQSANVFDFHAVALAPTFFLFALYFLETERWGWFAVFSVLTMSCKEDMPLLVVMLGLYALAVHRNWRVGLPAVAVSGAWFLAAVGWIMPRFDTQAVSPFSNRYAYLGDGPVEMAVTLVTRPGLVLGHLLTAENLAYLRDWLAPGAFVSLLAPQVLVLAVPTLAINLLSTEGTMHQLEGFHYGALLAPVAVVATAYGAAWLMRRLPGFRQLPLILAAAVLAATLLYHYGHGYTPLAADFRGTWPQVTAHDRLGQEMARSIPAEASLAALPYLNPHASQRRQLYMIDRVENGLPAPLHDADYVWLDVTNGWPLHPNDLKTGVENLFAVGYGVEEARDGWLLLRRGVAADALPTVFYDFARVADPQPEYRMHLQFLLDGTPVLECLGFDLGITNHESRITLYWRTLQPLPSGLHLYPFFVDDASGQVLEDTSLRPMIATVWYPPDRWQPGEIIQTSTLPWNVGPTFSIGLGVVQGDDWGDVNMHLPIRVESSEQTVRLFDGDTWARLLHVEGERPVEERRVFTPPAPQHSLDAGFAGQIRLLGYDLSSEAGGTRDETRNTRYAIHLTLYWQAQQHMNTSYTVFAQLLGPAGNVRTQVDTVPQDGSYPTVWWLPGEIVADALSLELPSDAPRNVPYRLIVGLYDPTTGARLPVTGSDADFVELTTLSPSPGSGG
jgi:uncharacterized membrane protein